MSHRSAVSAMRSRPEAPLRLFVWQMIRNVVPYSSPREISGAIQSRMALRLPMLISGGMNPCTGSKTHSAGRKRRINDAILCVPNLKSRSSPSLSARKSGVSTFVWSAPASRSLRFSFWRTLSSVVRNATESGLRSVSAVSSRLFRPLLNAATMLHHSVVLPVPPSAANKVICPFGTQPGISHAASRSSKSLRGRKHSKNASSAASSSAASSGLCAASCAASVLCGV